MLFFVGQSKAQEVHYKDLNQTAKKGEYTSYIASDGAEYKVGDKIRIGVPSSNKTFAFIYQGDGIIIPMTLLPAANSGSETEIKKIYVSGTKRSGFQVSMRTKGMYALTGNYLIQFENALSTGEIKGFGMTSNDALEELKRAKDKLDLGLITQEEFNNKKEELSKYIK
jgi:hypothetical protein